MYGGPLRGGKKEGEDKYTNSRKVYFTSLDVVHERTCVFKSLLVSVGRRYQFGRLSQSKPYFCASAQHDDVMTLYFHILIERGLRTMKHKSIYALSGSRKSFHWDLESE
jgi:hypothetical protein